MRDEIKLYLKTVKENDNLRELAENFLHQGFTRTEIEAELISLQFNYDSNREEIQYNAILDTLDCVVGWCSPDYIIRLKAGTKVVLSSTNEKGIIIHGWFDEQMACIDYYIAFFGDEYPTDKPKKSIYVLRYLESSIRVVQ